MTSPDIIQGIVDCIIHNEDATDSGVVTNDPSDSGGRTQWGISEKSNPEAWADGKVTREEAQEIYFQKYIYPFRGIADQALLHQLVDWAVPSGPVTVIRILQQIVGVNPDGVVGPKTLEAIEKFPSMNLFGVQLAGAATLKFKLRDARITFHAATAKHRPKDLKFLLGWLRRAMEFV